MSSAVTEVEVRKTAISAEKTFRRSVYVVIRNCGREFGRNIVNCGGAWQ